MVAILVEESEISNSENNCSKSNNTPDHDIKLDMKSDRKSSAVIIEGLQVIKPH